MSQDARASEEQSTRRRSQILGLAYFDTTAAEEKPLYKDLLTIDELNSLKDRAVICRCP